MPQTSSEYHHRTVCILAGGGEGGMIPAKDVTFPGRWLGYDFTLLIKQVSGLTVFIIATKRLQSTSQQNYLPTKFYSSTETTPASGAYHHNHPKLRGDCFL